MIASGATAATVIMAAIVFGASLHSMLSTPASYGWPWDAAVMGGYGYGSQDVDAIKATMGSQSDVERWTALGFGTFTLDDEPLVMMVGLGAPAQLDLTVVDGTIPTGDDQVALGARTAASRHLSVGEEVKLGDDGLDPRTATVTALVVLPALGPLQADRATPGTGMVLPAAMFDAATIADNVSFVGIETTAGTNAPAVLHDLHDDFISWATQGDTPFEYATPVRPPEIINADSMSSVPLLVGGLSASPRPSGSTSLLRLLSGHGERSA